MDLAEKIEQVADRVREQKDFIEGGESTKSTFVAPFIEALGYDRYDPEQVAPDFSVGGPREAGQTVDYALLHDGAPAILVDCKPAGTELSPHQARRLLRGLQATEARVGLLTNGVEYHVFCDRQRVGEDPFVEFDLLSYNVLELEILKRLCASTLDLEDLISRVYESKTPALDDDSSKRDSGSETGGSGGVLQVFDTVVGGVVTTVKVVAGAIAFIIGAFVVLFIVIEIYDEDGGATAQDFVKRRSQILETVESDLRAGRFEAAMDTADTYLQHVQDSTLQALRDEAGWARRHDVDAYVACGEEVKEQFQRPSEAEVPPRGVADTIAYLRDRRFRIRSHVDLGPAEASEHVPFTCVVETDEGRRWSLQSLDIDAR